MRACVRLHRQRARVTTRWMPPARGAARWSSTGSRSRAICASTRGFAAVGSVSAETHPASAATWIAAARPSTASAMRPGEGASRWCSTARQIAGELRLSDLQVPLRRVVRRRARQGAGRRCLDLGRAAGARNLHTELRRRRAVDQASASRLSASGCAPRRRLPHPALAVERPRAARHGPRQQRARWR